MRTALTVPAGLVAVLALVACGFGSDPDGDGAHVFEERGADATTAPGGDAQADTTAAPGTRQNPIGPGVAFAVGDWTVELAPTNTDATDLITAENLFNEPPVEGRQFVVVEVALTYTGEDSGHPWLDLTFTFYGAGGNTFGSSLNFDDECGVVPDDLLEIGEMFPGASATGNVCVSVPTDQIDGGAWIVEHTLSLDSDRTFVAIG